MMFGTTKIPAAVAAERFTNSLLDVFFDISFKLFDLYMMVLLS
jgi:hypothetical protein